MLFLRTRFHCFITAETNSKTTITTAAAVAAVAAAADATLPFPVNMSGDIVVCVVMDTTCICIKYIQCTFVRHYCMEDGLQLNTQDLIDFAN